MYVYTYICMYICFYVSMFICIYMYVYMYVYIVKIILIICYFNISITNITAKFGDSKNSLVKYLDVHVGHL